MTDSRHFRVDNSKLAVLQCQLRDIRRRYRGLLCTNCNTALGLLKEDPERVQALLLYVQTLV
jgi:hypothetical protein